METTLILLGLSILLFLVYTLFKEIKNQKKSNSKSKLDRSLDRKLLTMLGGDKKTALRLLRNVRKNHPGRSYLWYHEKAIRDLERDRRS